MLTVRVSGSTLSWPNECGCCGEQPDVLRPTSLSHVSGKRVIHTDTRTYQVPYCNHCAGHLDGWSRPASDFQAAVLTALTCGAYAVFAILKWRREAPAIKAYLKPKCVSGRFWPVRLLDWQGHSRTFGFINHEAGSSFMRVNRDKLLDVPPALMREISAGVLIPNNPAEVAANRKGPQRPWAGVLVAGFIWLWVGVGAVGVVLSPPSQASLQGAASSSATTAPKPNPASPPQKAKERPKQKAAAKKDL